VRMIHLGDERTGEDEAQGNRGRDR